MNADASARELTTNRSNSTNEEESIWARKSLCQVAEQDMGRV